MKIGILALQGAVAPHAEKLSQLGATPVEVRKASELEDLQGIILPGGESTAMIHLLHLNQLWEPLKAFTATKPAWGVCAGAILLAKEVTSPAQESLGVIDIEVARNAFGRQIDSFISPLEPTEYWRSADGKKLDLPTIEGVFIRAPRILRYAPEVRPLLKYNEEVVMVESGQTLVSTFHPELSSEGTIHQYFLRKCER